MTDPTTHRPGTVESERVDDPERTATVPPVTPAPVSAAPAESNMGPLPAPPTANSPFGARRVGRTWARHEQMLGQTVPVASFRSYEGAADAVARLAGTGFPIERITIVGCDLRILEEVTGRMNLGRSAAMGAVSGAWFGALVAALVGIFASSIGAFLGLLLWGIILGAVFGAGLGILGFLVLDRSRGFTSDRTIVAGRYDLHAPADVADQLRSELLTHRPGDVRIIDGHPR